MILARKDFSAANLREFIAYLKQNGETVKQAHGGIGASSHMAWLLFTSKAQVKPNLVAYRRTGPALNDLMGGVSISSAIRRWASPGRYCGPP